MGYARCIVSAQLLIDRLNLPPNTVITSVAPNYHGGYCDVELTVAHPDLADPVGDEIAPLVTPTFRKQDPIVFEGWGQKASVAP